MNTLSRSLKLACSIGKLLLVALLILLQAPGGEVAHAASDGQPLKVGFVIVGPVSDWSWSYAHDQGRLYAESKLSGKVTTTVAENVPESSEAERVMEKMIAQGCKLIFATSFGYLEPLLHVAERHPDVKFMQIHRFASRSNLGTYFFFVYQPMYAAGIVAGRITKVNKIGYVTCRPVPEVLQNLNAFALGAQSVNPKVKIKVVWTNTWADAPIEAEAAKGLIETGIDVLAYDPGSAITLAKTAESHSVYVIGCNTDVHKFAPNYWLTGGLLDWGPFYLKTIQSVLDNTWKSGLVICDAASGVVKLSSFGPAVSKVVQREALNTMAEIRNGKLVVFKGPIRDREGKTRLAAGQKPDIKWLGSMNFLVPGIEGSLPSK
jgi:basic membrane lipoprotein Med (substrate-binding protein (PBP1-ABC) superfamily)